MWNHFSDLGDNTAKCGYCPKKGARGSFGNLHRYLKNVHPAVILSMAKPVETEEDHNENDNPGICNL